VFLDKWARVKGELSDEQFDLLAKLRHECRGGIDNTIVLLRSLHRPSPTVKIKQRLSDVESNIRALFALLQEFIVRVSYLRKAISQHA
jgi:hypothetical protein